MRLLVLAMLVACAAPARWKPPELAETTRIQDGLIVRYEPDDTISVTAQVALGAVTASGHILLRRGDLATAATSEHVRLARARAWRALAAILIGGDPEGAYRAAKNGTDALQVLYVGNDGNMRAGLYAENENFPLAARTMASSLHESLRAYVRRFHDEVW